MAELRKCIGSTRFGIEAHEAAIEDFPVQPSQKDGLGRMCKPHWTQYTRALRTGSIELGAKGTPSLQPARQERAAKNDERRAKAEAAKKKPARATRRKGGPIGYIGSEPSGPVEVLPGGKRRRIASGQDEILTNAAANRGEDPELAAELDAILTERRRRVKAWRREELAKPHPMVAPGAGEG